MLKRLRVRRWPRSFRTVVTVQKPNDARAKSLAVLIAVAVFGLPLLGAVLGGREAREFLKFPPPLEIPSDYVRFSWLAAIGVMACVGGLAASWMSRWFRKPGVSHSALANGGTTAGAFPAWGGAAAGWTIAWWILAWTRWPWFEPLQRYTFFPLWVGFIITVNAATYRRTGSCLMLRERARWLVLFAASAGCWWTFEWLNRFVRNWHYLGVEDHGPIGYALHATLCFSTVLPAVAAVAEWTAAHASWMRNTAAGPRWAWVQRPAAGWMLCAGGGWALFGTGVWPEKFYPALWVAPLALLLAAPLLIGRRGLVHEIAAGDWSRAATWMLAALICGFFWELWNWRSLAKWIYTVPGVERWHVFEMPLLGYVGYLPFGLECLLVAERVIGNDWLPWRSQRTE